MVVTLVRGESIARTVKKCSGVLLNIATAAQIAKEITRLHRPAVIGRTDSKVKFVNSQCEKDNVLLTVCILNF